MYLKFIETDAWINIRFKNNLKKLASMVFSVGAFFIFKVIIEV